MGNWVRNRQNLERRFHHLYAPLPYAKRTVCWYCGDAADTRDHCPSLLTLYEMGADTMRRNSVELLLIPCCRECNSLLGAAPVLLPDKRGFWCNEKIQRRYFKTLNAKTFDEYDLEEFTGRLKQSIEAHIIVKSWVERRLYFTGRFPSDEDILRQLRRDHQQSADDKEVIKLAKVLRKKVPE